MKVGELIELLRTFPPDLKVVVAEDWGGCEEVDSAFQAEICDNHGSQPKILFGLIKRDASLPTTYRISKGDAFETGKESAVVLDF